MADSSKSIAQFVKKCAPVHNGAFTLQTILVALMVLPVIKELSDKKVTTSKKTRTVASVTLYASITLGLIAFANYKCRPGWGWASFFFTPILLSTLF